MPLPDELLWLPALPSRIEWAARDVGEACREVFSSSSIEPLIESRGMADLMFLSWGQAFAEAYPDARDWVEGQRPVCEMHSDFQDALRARAVELQGAALTAAFGHGPDPDLEDVGMDFLTSDAGVELLGDAFDIGYRDALPRPPMARA